MKNIDTEFFKGKRPWSKIKDRVLGGYLVPYFQKVKQLNKDIIIVDCFAGPGKFEDGSIGSPIMICQIGDQNAAGKFRAYLVNNEEQHHLKLMNELNPYIKRGCAFPVHADAKTVLEILKGSLIDQTLLIYLDPFGLKEFNFSDLLPFLKRNKDFSTELIINVSVPIIHRLSCKNSIKNGVDLDEKTIKWHDQITAALGGDYWKKYIFDESLSASDQIQGIIQEYTSLLRKYLPIVGSCIVNESTLDSTIKYFIVFASRHIDSAVLLNDIMFDAYHEHIWKSESTGTLFESQTYEFVFPASYFSQLKNIIMESIRNKPKSRKHLWDEIVADKFMKFKSKDYRNSVKELIKIDKKLSYTDVSGTGRINDSSILNLK